MTNIVFPSRVERAAPSAADASTTLPLWVPLTLILVTFVAYIGTVFGLYGVHGDYDTFLGRSVESPFWFVEEWQLLSVARPVAVWVSNIPLYPMEGLADFPWARAFGIATLCIIGLNMTGLCVRFLRIRPFDALALAVVVITVPAFSVSIMNIAAWGPYQTSVWFGLCAYTSLSRLNRQIALFRVYATLAQYRGFGRHLLRYVTRWRFVLACLFFQVGLYDYPSNALVICLFPVMVLLFSQVGLVCRLLIACRDIAFVGANLLFYFLTTKLIYFPILRATYPVRVFPDSGYTSYYRFELQRNPIALLSRLSELLRVAGNLWFLPQSNAFIFVGVIIIGALLLRWASGAPSASDRDSAPGHLDRRSWQCNVAFGVAIAAVCYFISAAPILLSIGGFVDYRTIAAPTGLTGVILLYALQVVARSMEERIAFLNPLRRRLPEIAMVTALTSAIVVTAYHVHVTVRLALNEFAYVGSLIRQAVEGGAETLVVLDWRPVFPPNKLHVAYDQRHHAIMPYQLGCFSSYCFSQPAIYSIARQQLGYAKDRLRVTIFRAEDARGLTCNLFTSPDPTFPAELAAETIAKIESVRRRGPVSCVPFNLAWHNAALSADTWTHGGTT